MREYEYVFDTGLSVGLAPQSDIPINFPCLVELKNLRPTKYGLMSFDAVHLPYSANQPYYITDHEVDWPFPRVFILTKHTLLGTREHLYEVQEDGSLTQLLSYNSSELWEVADFHEYIVATKDGSRVLERDPSSGAWNLTQDIPLCQSLINLNGQLFLGNLSPWGSWTDVDEDFVGWSDIGSANFVLSEKNEAGYRRVDFVGPVVEVKQLGNMAVVYGYDGVAFFVPVREPAATFAYKRVSDVGVYNKGAVAHSLQLHRYVGADGYLYEVTAEGVKRLGYDEQMQELSTGTILGFHDTSKGDSYFGDGSKTYVMTPAGLCERTLKITSLTRHNGRLYGVTEDLEGEGEVLAVTNTLDFGYRGNKTTEVIEVGGSGSGTFYVALDYRKDTAAEFETTEWVESNPEGVAVVKVYATEFRVRVKCTGSGVNLSYLKVRYKMSDLRSIRGVYAPPPRGQKVGE